MLALAMTLAMSAQRNAPGHHFSPEKFDAELKQFITTEAALSQQEAAKFFPIYQEMLQKQRQLFGRQRHLNKTKPADEQGCKKVIQERDNIDMELKRIQKQYHDKFFEILPASKVYDIIMAEDKFHRSKLKQWSHGPRQDHKK